ncbi:MAG TPA: winged helix-turn-helix domain-containing protein [Acidimicrobiales bacterium]
MARPLRIYELDDASVQVLAHPLRLRLLALLRADGPATASSLAERVGESSGVTSYHLRRLADAGFIEDDPGRGTGRDRWWRSAQDATKVSHADFLGDPAAHRASISVRREINRWYQRLVDQWLAEEADWDKAWVDAAGSSDWLLRLTPAQAKALREEILDVVRRYNDDEAAEDDPDAERVVWFQHLVPARNLPF